MPEYLDGDFPYEPAAGYGVDPSTMDSPPECGNDPNSLAATNRMAIGGYGGSLIPESGGSMSRDREQGYNPQPD